MLSNKDALKRYEVEYGHLHASQKVKQSVLDTIISRSFWPALESMRELLQPIDECLKMSESGKSNLGHVLDRWKDFLRHLEAKKREFAEVEMFLSSGTFANRFARQVLPIHIVAYYLTPLKTLSDIRNSDKSKSAIPINFEHQIGQFFRSTSSSEADAKTLIHEFACFRTQQHPFEPARLCWEEAGDTALFWELARGLTRFLSQLATRIFSTPVNSVASERAFSVQNLIHTKIRNRLHSVQADKLAYTYTNGRILSTFDGRLDVEGFQGLKIDDLTSEEEVMLEEMLLEIEAEDTTSKIGSNGEDVEEVDKEDDDGLEDAYCR